MKKSLVVVLSLMPLAASSSAFAGGKMLCTVTQESKVTTWENSIGDTIADRDLLLRKTSRTVLQLDSKYNKEADYKVPLLGVETKDWTVVNPLPGLSFEQTQKIASKIESPENNKKLGDVAIAVFAPEGGFLGAGEAGSWKNGIPSSIGIHTRDEIHDNGGYSHNENRIRSDLHLTANHSAWGFDQDRAAWVTHVDDLPNQNMDLVIRTDISVTCRNGAHFEADDRDPAVASDRSKEVRSNERNNPWRPVNGSLSSGAR